MHIKYTADAFSSLVKLVNFIEETNTEGAGIRWLNKFEFFLTTTLPDSLTISLCNNQTFKRFQLRCLHFNDWIVAFSVHEDYALIEAVIHKSRIVD